MPDNHCLHQEHVILPIGIINEATGAGTTIRLIPPHPSADKLQPQATILTRDSETGAHARAVVSVLGIQGNLVNLEVLELETEWPEGVDPSKPGSPYIWPFRTPSTRTQTSRERRRRANPSRKSWATPSATESSIPSAPNTGAETGLT